MYSSKLLNCDVFLDTTDYKDIDEVIGVLLLLLSIVMTLKVIGVTALQTGCCIWVHRLISYCAQIRCSSVKLRDASKQDIGNRKSRSNGAK